jgi:hypothetical protein
MRGELHTFAEGGYRPADSVATHTLMVHPRLGPEDAAPEAAYGEPCDYIK